MKLTCLCFLKVAKERCCIIAQVSNIGQFLKLWEVALDNYLEDRSVVCWQFRSSARKAVFPLWSCSSVTCSVTSFSFSFSEWHFLTTLRQRPLQKQAGPLTGFSDVEQNTGVFLASWAELSCMHEAKRFYPSERNQDDYFHIFILFFVTYAMHMHILFFMLSKYVFFTTLSFRLWGSSLD